MVVKSVVISGLQTLTWRKVERSSLVSNEIASSMQHRTIEANKIEIDIGSLQKAEKRVWVKQTQKRKGHYRKIKGAEKVDEPIQQLLPGFKDMTFYYDFENYDEIDNVLLNQKDEDGWLPAFENMIVNIGGSPHYFIAEAWYDGCIESREYDMDTNPSNIANLFKGIAQEETKLGVLDHAEYLPDSNIGQYGVSYITKKVPESLTGKFYESQYNKIGV